jgi:hypothetical protein
MHVYEGKSRSGKDLSELTDLEDITVKGGNQYKPAAVINPQEVRIVLESGIHLEDLARN